MSKLFSVLLCCNTEIQNVLLELSPSIYQAYKIILTRSAAQVASERTFSKLKYAKNCLRIQLSEDRLDSLLLVCASTRVSNDMVIDELPRSNAET